LLVFKALHGLLPPYLADDCQLLADTRCRQLRSSDVATCSVLWTHSSLGDRCFAVAGPRTWNSLPIDCNSLLNYIVTLVRLSLVTIKGYLLVCLSNCDNAYLSLEQLRRLS